MDILEQSLVMMLHGRIGSLEMLKENEWVELELHCRIGSLESLHSRNGADALLHCRIGSLEKTTRS